MSTQTAQPLAVGDRVEFWDGKQMRRGRVNGIIPAQMPTPVREDTEFYPGGYSVGRYRVTPAWGQIIRPLADA